MNPSTQPASTQTRSVLMLTREDVAHLLTMNECITAVEQAFRLYAEGALPPPAILGTHVTGGGFHIKTGVMPSEGALFYAAKTNANFPANRAKHSLPTIQGVVLLFDAECGTPLAIMDSIEITALRTGAATGVAAKYLARKNSRISTIIGCGTQARYQLSALQAVLSLDMIYAYDADASRCKQLSAEMTSVGSSTKFEVVNDFTAATKRSDVIVTCTTSTSPFLLPDHVHQGTFIAAVGADNEEKQELDPRLLVGNRLVPDVIQQGATIGEFHHALDTGLLQLDSVNCDLGQVVAGLQPGRTSDAEITIFDSTGMALQDVATACAIYHKALRSNCGVRIPLNS